MVFTKSIAFEKALIDKLEQYLTLKEGAKRINFSAEITELIEAGMKYKQLEKEGRVRLPAEAKPSLADVVRKSGLEAPKPSGLRIHRL